MTSRWRSRVLLIKRHPDPGDARYHRYKYPRAIHCMSWHDASDLVGIKYGCTEYAVKRLTGRDLIEETGLPPERIGFENVDLFTGGQCQIYRGTGDMIASGELDGTMLRVLPAGQDERHTVIMVDGGSIASTIEDQSSRRAVPTRMLAREWARAGRFYARCSVR